MRQAFTELACSFWRIVEILAVFYTALVAVIADAVEYLDSSVFEDEVRFWQVADPSVAMWTIDLHRFG